jgi:hypothetical protein
MPDMMTPAQCYETLLPELHALMASIWSAPTDTRGLALSMLYGLFVFTLRAFAHADDPMTPRALAELLAGIEGEVIRVDTPVLH